MSFHNSSVKAATINQSIPNQAIPQWLSQWASVLNEWRYFYPLLFFCGMFSFPDVPKFFGTAHEVCKGGTTILTSTEWYLISSSWSRFKAQCWPFHLQITTPKINALLCPAQQKKFSLQPLFLIRGTDLEEKSLVFTLLTSMFNIRV